jgi:hypothetical protein
VAMEKIPFIHLPDLEGLFLTGTSLHVLPVSMVNDILLPTGNPTVNDIMKKFQTVVHNHLK